MESFAGRSHRRRQQPDGHIGMQRAQDRPELFVVLILCEPPPVTLLSDSAEWLA
ncbi:MAG: hypothetical protein JF888_09425 [Candidatus Dormibacteraeota bacterium]|uniref:Uncharacterized protein n=1 Tax=Candidatus Dormiibacter inghamiae TaxID=3127013 RepID=A0A934KH40_9BACT|nr:hypothetical protein [Candidatus Dormibacteraeota bacterium]MBJ7606790.1 hypothetical protein [Candidatus Dormibacteraeota bacterium]